jgi:hypothetical protein
LLPTTETFILRLGCAGIFGMDDVKAAPKMLNVIAGLVPAISIR